MSSNKMLIDATHPEETRVVVLRGGRVEEFDYESAARKLLRGNIYLAKVTRVEPSLQAAFVDYGGHRHGFLAFNEIHPDYYQIPIADRQALLEEEAAAEAAEEAAADAAAEQSAESADAAERAAVDAPELHRPSGSRPRLKLLPAKRSPWLLRRRPSPRHLPSPQRQAPPTLGLVMVTFFNLTKMRSLSPPSRRRASM